MKAQNETLLHKLATIVVFGTCLALFAGLAVALMIVGILWAFQLLFTVGWWGYIGGIHCFAGDVCHSIIIRS